MLNIRATDLHVDFPVYGVKARSLRHRVLPLDLLRRRPFSSRHGGATVGAGLDESATGRIVVRALDGVSFELREGDRVGIVGPNGAGKTTLLRVIAGILEPVRGEIVVEGNCTPLFNMNDGMDPDATGYENIILRGRILGFSREFIASKVEEIAEFSDLGEYLDIPIRAYSSGMLVRLAFGIATAIEPEILVMDEMIGAGDAKFFDRAQERLRNFVSRSGIMVVATHSPAILQTWCNKGMLLHGGQVAAVGTPDEVLAAYDKLIGRGG